jgi:hypothetical protein
MRERCDYCGRRVRGVIHGMCRRCRDMDEYDGVTINEENDHD